MRGILCTQDRSISGRDKAGPVPLSRHSLLHFCADGLQVPRHPGAARACAARVREEAASHARTSRYGTVKLLNCQIESTSHVLPFICKSGLRFGQSYPLLT